MFKSFVEAHARPLVKPVRKLASKDALRVQRAEKLLRTGKPARALTELQCLTRMAWSHPRTENLVWRAAVAIG